MVDTTSSSKRHTYRRLEDNYKKLRIRRFEDRSSRIRSSFAICWPFAGDCGGSQTVAFHRTGTDGAEIGTIRFVLTPGFRIMSLRSIWWTYDAGSRGILASPSLAALTIGEK